MLLTINIDDIPAGGLGLELDEILADDPVLKDLAHTDGVTFIAPLQGSLTVTPIRGMVELAGRLRSRISTVCSRCLTSMDHDLDTRFHLMYARRPGVEAPASVQKEIELTTEDVGLMLFEGETIDLRQGIYEELLAALPLKPLCREECRGICPNCGNDLNREDCRCAQTDVDPRLAKLMYLKKR
jgi:uncharacterized protein